MGDNNWDLGAVVRKWNNRPTRDNTNNVGTEPVVPSLGLESVTFEKDDDWFNDYLSAIDDDSSDTFEGLSLMFSSDDFPVAQQQTPVIQSPNSIITNPTSFPFAVDDVPKDQNETQPQLLQPIQTALLSQQMFPPPPPPPPPPAVAVSAPAPQQMIPRRKPGRPPKRAKVFPSVTVPVARNSRVIKTRKRKNSPLLKVVREMTYDELLNDKWAWRKYGQKPIRGTPYPRNYYRCSTDKYCIARKYLERSPRDPSLFIVSLYGEHSHEPPANINSLSGSTRSTKSIKDLSTVPDPTPSSYSSPSPVSGSSFSPVSPMTPMFDTESALPNKNHMMEQAEEEENKGGNEEEKIDLIPNDFMIEDFFMSFEELEGSAYNNFGKGRFF